MPRSAQTAMRPLQRSLPLKLLLAREAVMERFRPHLHSHGVTEQQWRVLRALSEAGEIELSVLAKTVSLLLPSLSRIVPDLERRGLLERRRAVDDRRTTLVRLTRTGRALFDLMSRRSEAIYREIETALEAAGCLNILSDLDRLIAALEPRAEETAEADPAAAKLIKT